MNNYLLIGSNNSVVSEFSDCGSGDDIPSTHTSPLADLSTTSPTLDICRDYLRNTCKRGSYCRYNHPDSKETYQFSLSMSGNGPVFCHDFQNTGCQRRECRFVHCSQEEETTFYRTGKLSSATLNTKDAPICLDHFSVKGCRRGAKCKYRHFIADAEDDDDESEVISIKRRRKILSSNEKVRYDDGDSRLLREENKMLRRRVGDLERHLSILLNANELLLEQNAHQRNTSNLKQNPQPHLMPPIIAVSQLLAPAVGGQPALTYRAPPAIIQRHHQGPHGITVMASLTVDGRPRQNIVALHSHPALPLPHQTITLSATGSMAESASVSLGPTIDANVSIVPPLCTNLNTASLPQPLGIPLPQLPTHLPPPSIMPASQSLGSLICSNLISYPLVSHTRRLSTSGHI